MPANAYRPLDGRNKQVRIIDFSGAFAIPSRWMILPTGTGHAGAVNFHGASLSSILQFKYNYKRRKIRYNFIFSGLPFLGEAESNCTNILILFVDLFLVRYFLLSVAPVSPLSGKRPNRDLSPKVHRSTSSLHLMTSLGVTPLSFNPS